MSWDEALFSFAWTRARRWANAVPAEVLARRFEVEPEREHLERLARLLTGHPLTVVLTADAGGISGDQLFLPRTFDLASTSAENAEAARLRVVWSTMVLALQRAPWPADDARRGGGRAASRLPARARGLFCEGPRGLAMALAAPVIRAAVLEAFPSLEPRLASLEGATVRSRPTPPREHRRARAIEATVRLALRGSADGSLEPEAWEWARLAHEGVAPPLPPARRTLFAAEKEPPPVDWWGLPLALAASPLPKNVPKEQADALSGGTEAQRRSSSTPVARVDEPEQQLAENPLVHSFEKVHTLEEYKGGSKRIDGDDELAAHQKALDELDLRQVIRSHQRARSVYRADLLLDASVGELEGDDEGPAEALYDEWDEARSTWKRAWCRLTTRQVELATDAALRLREVRGRLTRTTTGLRMVFEQLEASRAWKLRQRSGSDVDVDALVARFGALRAGHCSDDRLYLHRRRHSRDTAVLVLLDASLSTDAWVANRRVMDVEREAVIALGDALDGLFDEVAVAAFTSQSRRDCRFLVAKGFRESWAVGAQRVVSLEPHGFTRIGPALRHATAELAKCGARQKLLLLVSDGKPSDVDRYEGRYGVSDVHRAVLDAQAVGVVTHALAVDPAAKAWLPSMFGHGRASVVARPEDLVLALAKVTSTALRA